MIVQKEWAYLFFLHGGVLESDVLTAMRVCTYCVVWGIEEWKGTLSRAMELEGVPRFCLLVRTVRFDAIFVAMTVVCEA